MDLGTNIIFDEIIWYPEQRQLQYYEPNPLLVDFLLALYCTCEYSKGLLLYTQWW